MCWGRIPCNGYIKLSSRCHTALDVLAIDVIWVTLSIVDKSDIIYVWPSAPVWMKKQTLVLYPGHKIYRSRKLGKVPPIKIFLVHIAPGKDMVNQKVLSLL